MTIPPNGNVCTRHESGSISPIQAIVQMMLNVFKRDDFLCLISFQKLHARTTSLLLRSFFHQPR